MALQIKQIMRWRENWIVLSLASASVLLGLGLTLNGGYLIAKAHIAQQLLAHSWHKGVANGLAHKPWFWADTDVAARIRFERLGINQYVMRDASGESLSFGPGFVTRTAIAGHRDSHFALLKELQPTDIVELERLDQSNTRYRITSSEVIDTRYQQLAVPTDNELVLITCFPFDSVVPGGPLRYIVFGEAIDELSQH